MKYELTYRCRKCEEETTEVWNDLPANVKSNTPKVKLHKCGIKEKGFESMNGIMEIISWRAIKE